MGIVTGVDGGAGPAGVLPLRPRCQHVAYLAVEVGEGWQSIKDEVTDPFDGVPERNRRMGQDYKSWEKFREEKCNGKTQSLVISSLFAYI